MQTEVVFDAVNGMGAPYLYALHSAKINDPAYCPADVKQEVMDYIRTYIY